MGERGEGFGELATIT
ncbi:hypothetical protein Tco_0501407, partial [Tanacetum coccineum]